ncbi:hypothetical protein PF010_g813 [Phytophthora fragariae]|uniref:Uncharacterized protein n=1 Tax=Phytophthora fragariae TaxID=53985 RepID=A0A6G0M1T3_9STRA|nr:hypothetical protein PF010_g813 [Phytophthora fragariae]
MLRECKLDSAVLRNADCCFSLLQPSGSRAAPSSSVSFLRPHYPSSSVQDAVLSPLDDARIFIKPEPLHNVDMDAVTERSFLAPVSMTNEREERLRCRQCRYGKRFRGCKTMSTESFLLLAQTTNQRVCSQKSLNTQAHPRNEAGRLAQEALPALRPPDSDPSRVAAVQDTAVAAGEVRARREQGRHEVAPGLGHITRVREYANKDTLRTVSEWRHSAVKVIDPVASVMSVDNYSCIVHMSYALKTKRSEACTTSVKVKSSGVFIRIAAYLPKQARTSPVPIFASCIIPSLCGGERLRLAVVRGGGGERLRLAAATSGGGAGWRRGVASGGGDFEMKG